MKMFRYLLLVVTPALVTGCCFPNQWESIQHVVYASKEPNDSPRLYEVSMTIFKRCLCFICSSSACLMRIFQVTFFLHIYDLLLLSCPQSLYEKTSPYLSEVVLLYIVILFIGIVIIEFQKPQKRTTTKA